MASPIASSEISASSVKVTTATDAAVGGTAGASPSNGSAHGPRQQERKGPRGGRDGGRGGRGGNRGGHGERQNQSGRGHGKEGRDGRGRTNMSRGEWSRATADKRTRNQEELAEKRRKIDNGEAVKSNVGVLYSAAEIADEDRKPKRKVAVLIGYAGTGYKGMQINDTGKTIEGDLFNAFVKAGAISKANADDPKKSSLVRCARTDKGVHAAGNVVSLKLIVEDPGIVKKINDNLPAQIRVWGFERTNGSFSCYQTCDSRWYEYLIPTYSFIPPHPQSYLGKKLKESAEREGSIESFRAAQEDAANFWEETEKNYVEPILATLDLDARAAVLRNVYSATESPIGDEVRIAAGKLGSRIKPASTGDELKSGETAESESKEAQIINKALEVPSKEATTVMEVEDSKASGDPRTPPESKPKSTKSPTEIAIAQVKAAIISAKKAYRISTSRRQRVQDALDKYLGTQNFHNYTVQKTFRDPSAKRVIRSFDVGAAPIIISGTEWLSLKVHGQSFMMHQIRKMVAMAALVVRCATPLERMTQSFGPVLMSIPKAPSLGLLLERPVFDSYNERAVRELDKEKIDFGKYETELEAFKQREIYERIFRVENEENHFHVFFHHLDHFQTKYFLWVTAGGTAEADRSAQKGTQQTGKTEVEKPELDSEDEADRDIKGEEG